MKKIDFAEYLISELMNYGYTPEEITKALGIASRKNDEKKIIKEKITAARSLAIKAEIKYLNLIIPDMTGEEKSRIANDLLHMYEDLERKYQ